MNEIARISNADSRNVHACTINRCLVKKKIIISFLSTVVKKKQLQEKKKKKNRGFGEKKNVEVPQNCFITSQFYYYI